MKRTILVIAITLITTHAAATGLRGSNATAGAAAGAAAGAIGVGHGGSAVGNGGAAGIT